MTDDSAGIFHLNEPSDFAARPDPGRRGPQVRSSATPAARARRTVRELRLGLGLRRHRSISITPPRADPGHSRRSAERAESHRGGLLAGNFKLDNSGGTIALGGTIHLSLHNSPGRRRACSSPPPMGPTASGALPAAEAGRPEQLVLWDGSQQRHGDVRRHAPAPITVTLDGNQSAGALVFNVSGSNGYTLSQGTGGALTLGTSAGASITVLSGTHIHLRPVVLAGSLAVSTTGGGSLELRQRQRGDGAGIGAQPQRQRGVDPERHGQLYRRHDGQRRDARPDEPHALEGGRA